MDIIIPTNHRPHRLITTLSTLYTQQIDEEKRLVLVDNSREDIFSVKQIDKLLKAFRNSGWSVEQYYSKEKSISRLKKEALKKGQNNLVALIDNDILFTRPDTLTSLAKVLREYDVACVSPLGYELDDERPVLNEFAHMYDQVLFDENGVGEGNIALGFFLMMNREDYLKNRQYWCDDLPYMEDQVLVHFLKKNRGYAFLNHAIYHIAYDEKPTYVFNDEEVIQYLEKKGEDYSNLLKLRRERKDGAEFSKPIQRKLL